MSFSQFLNGVGLCLGICGAVILFFWGRPQPDLAGQFGIGLEDGTRLKSGKTVAQERAEITAKRKHFERMSGLGLILIALGFLLQFLAVFADML